MVVKLGNRRKGCAEFGSWDFDNIVSVVKQKKIKNLLALGKNIVVSESRCLRAHIVMFVLIDNHLILLWFNKKVQRLSVLDSIENRSSRIVFVIKRSVVDFSQILLSFVKSKNKLRRSRRYS